jgi:hypothetical protein
MNEIHTPIGYGLNQLIETVPQGLECPKCKSVYSPTIGKCLNCPRDIIINNLTVSNQASQ